MTEKLRAELQRHKGNWPFIAKLFGVPYKTLQRFADGTTRHPREETVEAMRIGLAMIAKTRQLRKKRNA